MGSRRQHCITLSSCESELVALADTAIELIHTDAMLEHVGFRREGPISVGTDNKGAYDLSPPFHVGPDTSTGSSSRCVSCVAPAW